MARTHTAQMIAQRKSVNMIARREALRDELKGREAIRQVLAFIGEDPVVLGAAANPDNPRSPSVLDVRDKQADKALRILNKVMPDLKAISGEVAVHDANDQLNRAGALLGAAIGAIIEGETGPGSDPGETPGKDESVVSPACDPPET